MADPYRVPQRGAPLDIKAERGEEERAPAQAGAPPPPAPTLSLYLPEVFPIPGAQEFDTFAIVASPAAGTLTPAALRLQLPASSIGIVRVITAGVDDMTQATRLLFRLRVNEAIVPGPAGNFQLFAGVAARATASADVWVKLPAGAIVDLAIVNIDGAAYQVGAGFSGWWWAESLDANWRGQLRSYAARGPSL